jgi:hypothetical protein
LVTAAIEPGVFMTNDPDLRLETCPNCGQSSTTAYCPSCGQSRQESQVPTLRAWLKAGAAEVFHLDGKLPRSFRALAFQPGRLTHDWAMGRRSAWMSPLQLYVLIGILFFLVYPRFADPSSSIGTDALAGWLAGYDAGMVDGLRVNSTTGEPIGFEPSRLNVRLQILLPLISVPILAVVAFMFFAGPRTNVVPSLVYSLHLHSFAMLGSTLIIVMSTITNSSSIGIVNFGEVLLVLYAVLAAHRAYGGTWSGVITKSVLALLTYLALTAGSFWVVYAVAFNR